MVRKEKDISKIRSEVEALIGVQVINKIGDISETTSAYHKDKGESKNETLTEKTNKTEENDICRLMEDENVDDLKNVET